MPIEEVDPKHDLGVFNVFQTIQVFDQQTADALDHLLDHLDLLWMAALGVGDVPSAKVLVPWKHYGVTPTGFADGFDEGTLLANVQRECHILLDYLVRIMAAGYQGKHSIREQDEQTQIQLLAEMRARVPYVDFRY